MYTKTKFTEMCNGDITLGAALFEGMLACRSLTEGIGGKILTMAALVGSTILAGCASHAPELERAMDFNPTTIVNKDSVNTLASRIADGIIDEMRDSSDVRNTVGWRAAKDIYAKLSLSDKPLADMFSRIINRSTRDLSRPPCCDDKEFVNNEQIDSTSHSPVYDEEEHAWLYN